MSRARDQARNLVDRFPILASAYRDSKAWWAFRANPARPTVHGFTLATDTSFADGHFEPDETSWMLSRMDRFDVLVDVGAHHGYYACLAASRGKEIVAFEPNTTNLGYLLRNLVDNDASDARVYPLGLASSPGVRTFYGRSTGASLHAGWNSQTEHDATRIATSTLDLVLEGQHVGRRILVKVDVEGAELEVVEGAAKTLRRDPAPVWLVEICLTENQKGVNPTYAQTFERFWGAGYRSFTVEAQPREITPSDVERWIANGRRDFGSHNIAFEMPT